MESSSLTPLLLAINTMLGLLNHKMSLKVQRSPFRRTTYKVTLVPFLVLKPGLQIHADIAFPVLCGHLLRTVVQPLLIAKVRKHLKIPTSAIERPKFSVLLLKKLFYGISGR